MIRCTNAGIEPSYDCYDVCVLATRCKTLKAWEREKEKGEKKNKVVEEAKTKCIAQIYDIADGWIPVSERLPKKRRVLFGVKRRQTIF